MPECTTPLWPCAMTGAAACLAGFEGISVVIHGSSGCYYYPATLLHAPLHGTFILENEVIFGSGDRLREVIANLSGKGGRIAVITTCVPSALGEDIRSMVDDEEIIVVDSPGFAGELEAGYRAALAALTPAVSTEQRGVNIDGISLSDPFYEGNLHEVTRLLHRAGITVGTVFSCDRAGMAGHASPLTIGTNGDFGSGVGSSLGGTLGIPALRSTFSRLADIMDSADVDPVLKELDRQEERAIHACDKFLRRYDPPGVAVFAGAAYALFAADTLERYLDTEILVVGTRNNLPEQPERQYRVEKLAGLEEVSRTIADAAPDLVIGSSFERSLVPDRPFVGIIPPLRGKVRLSFHSLAGTAGMLSFIEEVLNACMDRTA
ncbi:nitrogenase component 1 [Methanoregula sp.]|uniref:nitrogenase component 1 n=1 Tax=Methanoregula sp. TaxID=2052170 RepID=UPI002C8301A9|nr:nitrogenase component 1 [Methanoregula sp.]HVP97088.1 nitrogenase component 1 [Methanoregula sp.]